MKRKIAVAFSAINDSRLERIKSIAPDFDVVVTNEDINDAEVIFGNVRPALLADAKKLKWMHTQTAGVNTYLAPGIVLPQELVMTNSSGAFNIGIAEHLLVMAMMLLRKMGAYRQNQNSHKWENLGAYRNIFGAEVCIVGLGDIGRRFAVLCKALGAKTTGVVRNPRKQPPDFTDAIFTADRLDEAISTADIVALCLPGTDETSNLFDAARLSKMKPGSIILNIGRGSAINGEALADALQSGRIAGAGLDVTHPEPLPESSPLWDMPNVIITPHISGRDSEGLTLDLVFEKFCRYLEEYVAGRPFDRVVDQKAGY